MKKQLLYLSAALVLLTGITAATACGGKKEEPKQNETAPSTDTTSKASAYVCPMGPQCGKGDAPGKCPGCGMEMVKNDKGLK